MPLRVLSLGRSKVSGGWWQPQVAGGGMGRDAMISHPPVKPLPDPIPPQIQFPSSLPTKTSFGPDGKKQLSRPTNDLQKLFLSKERTAENGVKRV